MRKNLSIDPTSIIDEVVFCFYLVLKRPHSHQSYHFCKIFLKSRALFSPRVLLSILKREENILKQARGLVARIRVGSNRPDAIFAKGRWSWAFIIGNACTFFTRTSSV